MMNLSATAVTGIHNVVGAEKNYYDDSADNHDVNNDDYYHVGKTKRFKNGSKGSKNDAKQTGKLSFFCILL